jgi:hypothetical protein
VCSPCSVHLSRERICALFSLCYYWFELRGISCPAPFIFMGNVVLRKSCHCPNYDAAAIVFLHFGEICRYYWHASMNLW